MNKRPERKLAKRALFESYSHLAFFSWGPPSVGASAPSVCLCARVEDIDLVQVDLDDPDFLPTPGTSSDGFHNDGGTTIEYLVDNQCITAYI